MGFVFCVVGALVLVVPFVVWIVFFDVVVVVVVVLLVNVVDDFLVVVNFVPFIVVLVLVVVVFVEAVSTNKSELSHDMRIRKGNSQKMKSSLISVSFLCMRVLLMSSSYSGF